MSITITRTDAAGALDTAAQTAVDARIKAKRPEFYVPDYYDSSVSTWYDSAFSAIATAVAATSQGATVKFPSGTFQYRDAPFPINRQGLQVMGSGRRSTWLQYKGAGSAIANPTPTSVLRQLGLRDFTLDMEFATAGAVGFDIENWYRAHVQDVEVYSGSVATTGIKLRGGSGKSTYFNTFTNVDVNANTCCVDIGELCNGSVFVGGVYDGNGSAILAGLTGTFVDSCRWIGTSMQTQSATLIQLGGGTGAGVARDFLFIGCRIETYPTATTITAKSGSLRNVFLACSRGITGGIGTTYVFEGAGDGNQVIEPGSAICHLGVGDADDAYFAINYGATEIMRVDKTGVGFHGATPVAQAAAITVPTGGTTTDTEARAAISAIITALKNVGITA